jgi:Reverse transcriptase (RNA-dependent DNA polymerase)
MSQPPGLKQAPRAWFHKLASTLFTLGFKASQSDSSLFILGTSSSILLVLVYVDDIMGSDATLVTNLISSLASQFSLKDLGPLHFFLGSKLPLNLMAFTFPNHNIFGIF